VVKEVLVCDTSPHRPTSSTDTDNADLLGPCGTPTSTEGRGPGLQRLLARRQSSHLLQGAVTMLQLSTHCHLKQFLRQGSKNPGFFKSPTQWVFFFGGGVYWGFLDKQEKIGKIIQKLSNLKP